MRNENDCHFAKKSFFFFFFFRFKPNQTPRSSPLMTWTWTWKNGSGSPLTGPDPRTYGFSPVQTQVHEGQDRTLDNLGLSPIWSVWVNGSRSLLNAQFCGLTCPRTPGSPSQRQDPYQKVDVQIFLVILSPTMPALVQILAAKCVDEDATCQI